MKKIMTIVSLLLIVVISLAYISRESSNSINTGDVHEAKSESDLSSCCVKEEQPEETDVPPCCSDNMEEMEKDNFTENSIYQVNSNWKNQFDQKVNIASLRGKIQVFSMIFANCTYACPIIANDMRRIEEALSVNQLKNLQFTLISIDPDRDSPERLMKFSNDQKLNSERWQLLTGSRSDIDDIAALTGFRYKKESDGSFSHSNIITIINEEGEIIHQQFGLNQDITKILEVIKNQIKENDKNV